MSYYGAGDYYRGGRGDLLSSIGGIAKRIFNVGATVAPSLPGVGILAKIPAMGKAAFGGGQRAGEDILRAAGVSPDPFGAFGGRKRRRMNPANPKALRRAIRRTEGFIGLAQKSLKGTGYHITRAHRLPAKKKRS